MCLHLFLFVLIHFCDCYILIIMLIVAILLEIVKILLYIYVNRTILIFYLFVLFRYDVLKAGQKRFDTDGLNTLKYTVKQVKEHLLYTWILVSIEPPR